MDNMLVELLSKSSQIFTRWILKALSHVLQLIKVYGEDSHSRSVWVSPSATGRDVCHMLVQTAHCSDQENWALLEVHPSLGLGKNTCQSLWTPMKWLCMYCMVFKWRLLFTERCLEDHEVVLEVQATWSLKSDTRFVFCKNYAKYEFFRKPMVRCPQHVAALKVWR